MAYSRNNATAAQQLLDQHPTVKGVVSDAKNLRSLLPNLAGIDALLSIPDPTLYNANTLPSIIRSLYRPDKVLIGYSPRLVQMGALARVYSQASELSSDIVELIPQSIQQDSPPKATFPMRWSILINVQLARSLNIGNIDIESLELDLREDGGIQ